MEHGETTQQAAAREAFEETGAVIDPNNLKFRAIYDVPGTIQLVYSVKVSFTDINDQIAKHNTDCGGSSAVELVTHGKLGEKELCFPTVPWSINARCRLN